MFGLIDERDVNLRLTCNWLCVYSVIDGIIAVFVCAVFQVGFRMIRVYIIMDGMRYLLSPIDGSDVADGILHTDKELDPIRHRSE